MTKTKLLGVVFALMLVFSGTASANAAEQVYAKSAPIATGASKPIQAKKFKRCKNWLVKELKRAGFHGKNLHEAWAIVMRESGGNARSISATHDYGMFQLNRATWHKQPWWNERKLLTKSYNAAAAYRVSEGGKTWRAWDMDGKGRWKGVYTSKSVYNKYVHWYNLYPC